MLIAAGTLPRGSDARKRMSLWYESTLDGSSLLTLRGFARILQRQSAGLRISMYRRVQTGLSGTEVAQQLSGWR